jgi:amino acid transporter
MEDTLRYFFSAIFQGVAAILTLGAMFYMNYLEKSKSRIKELELETKTMYNPDYKLNKQIFDTNIIEVMRDVFLPNKTHESYDSHRKIVAEYNEIIKKQKEIKKILPAILPQGIFILISSAIGLFIIGYTEFLNKVVFWMGIILLLITILFCWNLLRLILATAEITLTKFKNLFFVE